MPDNRPSRCRPTPTLCSRLRALPAEPSPRRGRFRRPTRAFYTPVDSVPRLFNPTPGFTHRQRRPARLIIQSLPTIVGPPAKWRISYWGRADRAAFPLPCFQMNFPGNRGPYAPPGGRPSSTLLVIVSIPANSTRGRPCKHARALGHGAMMIPLNTFVVVDHDLQHPDSSEVHVFFRLPGGT